MDNYKVDYHIHTTASDGQMKPGALVKQAKELGYDIIAITDHDNMDGIMEAEIAAEAVELRLVPGIEIAVRTEDGVEFHLLGYRLDSNNEELQSFLAKLKENRRNRNEELFATLRGLGYEIYKEDIEVGANDFIGKPLIARALLEKGYIKEKKEAFGTAILNSPQCLAVKKVKPLIYDAIQVILNAGGTPVLAHPIQTKELGRPGSEGFYKKIDAIIRDLKLHGLKGLECYHPDQNFEQSQRFVEIAEKYKLHITMGSDFHGDDYAKADKHAYVG